MKISDADIVDDLASFRGTPRRAFFEGLDAGNVKLVRDVLKHHPDAATWRTLRDDVQAEDEAGLHIAARQGAVAVARMLIVAGAPVDARDMDGESPVMHAIRHGREDAVRFLLIEAKADPNHRCGSDETPLMIAANEGFLVAAELLLERGANIQARCKAGNALHYAVDTSSASEPLIAALIAKGIGYDVRNDDGMTALELARDNRRPHADHLIRCIAAREGVLAAEALASREREIASIHSGTGRIIAVRRPLRLKNSPF